MPHRVSPLATVQVLAVAVPVALSRLAAVPAPEADGSAGSTGVSGRVYWRRVMSAYRSLVPSCSR